MKKLLLFVSLISIENLKAQPRTEGTVVIQPLVSSTTGSGTGVSTNSGSGTNNFFMNPTIRATNLTIYFPASNKCLSYITISNMPGISSGDYNLTETRVVKTNDWDFIWVANEGDTPAVIHTIQGWDNRTVYLETVDQDQIRLQQVRSKIQFGSINQDPNISGTPNQTSFVELKQQLSLSGSRLYGYSMPIIGQVAGYTFNDYVYPGFINRVIDTNSLGEWETVFFGNATKIANGNAEWIDVSTFTPEILKLRYGNTNAIMVYAPLVGNGSANSGGIPLCYTGRTNIGNNATSLKISINHTMPNTNYVPSISFMDSSMAAAVAVTYATITTTNFTITLSAGIAGGENIGWSTIYSP